MVNKGGELFTLKCWAHTSKVISELIQLGDGASGATCNILPLSWKGK